MSTRGADDTPQFTERINVELKKLEEHVQKTKDTKIEAYQYDPNNKSFTIQYKHEDRTHIFYLHLSENYPLIPPTFHLETATETIAPYNFKPQSLDDTLGKQWCSNTYIWEVATKYGEYIAELNTQHYVSSLERLFINLKTLNYTKLTIVFILLISILLRYGVGTAGYSGRNNSPEYGDYEVHRHWMELAVNLPVNEWYQESEQKYAYKGIDYPPFCMYLHYIMGRILKKLIPKSMEYYVSRGYESDSLKLYMRSTIVIFDLLVFCTGFLYFLYKFYKNLEMSHKLSYLSLAINIPCILLIDHGHFHHNCVMLGICLWSMSFILSKQYVLATFIYCLGINFKQMSLYYSIAFFPFVFIKIYTDSSHSKQPIVKKLVWRNWKIVWLVIITIGTNLVLWSPYIFSKNAAWKVVLQRIFPIYRGLYEDKVANFWCFINNFINMRSLFSHKILTLFSASCTLLGCIPSIMMVMKRPNRKAFIMSVFNISMSFYMFSYMVHEKTILLPLLPLTMLFYTYCHVFTTMMLFGLFSNFFLLQKDECDIPYFAILILYAVVGYDYEIACVESIDRVEKSKGFWVDTIIELVKGNHRLIKVITVGVIICFHLMEWFIVPPERLPDIFSVLNVNLSFIVFFSVWIYSHLLLYKHINESKDEDTDLIGGYELSIKAKQA